MRRFKMELCYDGGTYSGWQVQISQPGVRTIQGELEKALAQILGQRLSVSGSGRTDAGVHALFQVAAFSSDTLLSPETLTRALNALLPPDIRIWRILEVPFDFHPLRNIARKRYRYLLSDSRPFFPFVRDYVWFCLKKLDFDAMQQAAVELLGKHDFSAFETVGSPRNSSIRTIFDVQLTQIAIDSIWSIPVRSRSDTRSTPSSTGSPIEQSSSLPENTIFSLEVEADGFLYNMVRAITGTLVLFGNKRKGFEDPTSMRTIIESGRRDLAGPTAPPHGLYMIDVQYKS